MVVASFVSAIVPWLVISNYGVDVPFVDEWDVGPPLFDKLSKGTLHLSDLFAQHNEHRIAVTRLIVLASGPLTHYNVKTLMYLTFALACATAVIIYWLGQKTLRDRDQVGTGTTFLLSLLANLLLFSAVQYENWLWSMQLQFFVPSLCLVAGLLVAHSNLSHAVRFLTAIVLSVLGTYSSANGMLLWGLLLPSLLISGRPAAKNIMLRWTVLWIGAAALTILPYFYGYQTPIGHPSLLEAFRRPLDALEFFLIYLGTPLTPVGSPTNSRELFTSRIMAIAIGAVLTLLFVIACVLTWQRRERLLIRRIPWLSLGAYAICTDALTDLGRVGFGTDQAFWSRYTTIAICLIVSLIYLIPIVYGDVRPENSSPEASQPPVPDTNSPFANVVDLSNEIGPHRDAGRVTRAIAPLGLAIFLLCLFSSVTALQMSRVSRTGRLSGKASLLFIRHLKDDMLIGLAANGDNIRSARDGAEVLQSLGYLRPGLIESPRLKPLLKSNEGEGLALGGYRLDRVPERLRTRQTSKDHRLVSGWAIDPALKRAPDAVVLTYESEDSEPLVFGVAEVGKPRPDVSKAMKDSDYLFSGWARIYSIAQSPPKTRKSKLGPLIRRLPRPLHSIRSLRCVVSLECVHTRFAINR